jgi:putative ABC transport system permease protein
LVLLLMRVALLDEWRAQLPENAPNHFVMNVTEEDLDEVQTLLDEHTDHDGRLFPMFRGRVVGVNGKSVQEWDALSGATAPSTFRSERNLTWAEVLPSNNLIVNGEWWSMDEAASLISLESDFARAVGLELGDELEFDVGGFPVVAKVANTRRVEWESMQPNFFIIFSRAALRGLPTTYMTSFYLESNRKKFLNQLLLKHPTVTVIEIDEIIEQIQSIIGSVTHAVELVLILVVVAGVLVLTASIQASRDSRMKEHALLRALGGTQKLIAGSLAIEFAALGAFAGIVAVIGAEITAFLLQTKVFELTYEVHAWLWITGPVVGASLVATVGYLGTRRLVRSPPAQVLRDL